MAEVFVLVHPERFPSNEPDVIHHEAGWELSAAGFDAAYGDHVAAAAGAATYRFVVLDDAGMEDLAEAADCDMAAELTVGLLADGWEVIEAQPRDVARVTAAALRSRFSTTLPTVSVGGFARRDCVARVVAALARSGFDVAVDDLATLPLLDAGAGTYFDRLAR